MSLATANTDRRRFTVSERALARIRSILEAEENRGLMMRVSVSGGGCQGFQYGFSLDDRRTEDDVAVEHGGVVVLVDGVSLDLLNGAELDFKDELGGAYFVVANPNAASSCGCGTSFSL